MTRMTTAQEVEAELAFARQAAENFAQHPQHATFGNIQPGAYLAIRWGMGDDCVVVVKLDKHHEPTNYQQLIPKAKP